MPNDEALINHYGGIRFHGTGAGNLRFRLFSLDEVKVSALMPIALRTKSVVEPTRLANFTQQKAKLEVRITEIDETFSINNIIVFTKPVAKSYPGQ